MRPESVVVETELFPRGALDFYTAKNMGWDYTQAQWDEWFMVERGGDQGDYREGMPAKIANVVDCLKEHPHSKRAVIPIPFNSGAPAQPLLPAPDFAHPELCACCLRHRGQ